MVRIGKDNGISVVLVLTMTLIRLLEYTSELDFHIWNANSIDIVKMAAHGRKFCTLVSILFPVLYVSSSLLHDFNRQFFCGSGSKTFTVMEKVTQKKYYWASFTYSSV